MLLKIHTRGFELSNALSHYSDSKVRLALGLFRHKIRRVDVFLTDVNGPKGGEDMLCKIKIEADGCPSTIVHETADDMYEAINICCHRIKRSLARRLDRVTEYRRGQPGLQVSADL